MEKPKYFDKMSHQLSNVAGLSAEFHTHKLYQEFYDHIGPSLNGFTGIYDYIITIGGVMADFEVKAEGNLWEIHDNDWVEAMEFIVDQVMRDSLKSGFALSEKTIRERLKIYLGSNKNKK